MRKKVLIIILSFCFLFSTLLFGCAGKPENVVKKYFNSIRKGEFEEANEYLASGSKGLKYFDNFLEDLKFSSTDKDIQNAFKKLFREVEVEIISSEIKDETAIVKTNIHVPDISKMFLDLLPGILRISLISGNKLEEYENLIVNYINEKEVKITNIERDIELLKENNEWKIDFSIFDLFEIEGLPEFNLKGGD